MFKVRDVVIGQGKPKICVPVTAIDKEAALREACQIKEELSECVDLVELRIDYLKEVRDSEALTGILTQVREILGNIPLLCTLRTFCEGGELNVLQEEYLQILKSCIQSGQIDLLDVELFMGEEVILPLIDAAKEQQIKVLLSSHDFAKTPVKDELVERFMLMERVGADIAKIAVMPKSREDVLTLLEASSIANTCMDIPIVAISMGKLGTLSRIGGETFGSCMTFASGKRASAPGQISAPIMKQILEVM